MSRGRKTVKFKGTDWASVAKHSFGFYFEFILRQLASKADSLLTNKNTSELAKAIEKEKNVLLEKRKLRLNSSKPKNEITDLRFEIPKNWEWHLLSDFVFYQEGPGIRTHQYRTSGIKLLNVQNITQDKLMLDLTERFISAEEYESKYKHFTIEEEDILFASSGGSWGKTCWFENPNYKVILNTSTMRLRSFSEKGLLNNFLYAFLKTPFFRNQLIPQLMGMQPNFGSTHLNSVSIPIPPVDEQKIILKYLAAFSDNNLQDKIYFNEEVETEIKLLQQTQLNGNKLSTEFSHQHDLVKQLSLSLLTDAMQGKLSMQISSDGSATDLIKAVRIEKENLIAEKKLKKGKELPPIQEDEIPFEIPENWTWCRLGEICNYGSSPKAEPKHLTENSWVLDLEDIEKETSRLLCKIRFVERNSLSTKSVFKKGEVLYSKLRPYLDKVIVADEDGVCTTEILPLKFYGKINPFYLRYALKRSDFLRYVNSVTKGMKMPRLGTNEGQLALIPLPPIPEQKRIVEKLDEVTNLCEALKTAIGRNQKHSDLLLKVALKDALQSKEAEVK